MKRLRVPLLGGVIAVVLFAALVPRVNTRPAYSWLLDDPKVKAASDRVDAMSDSLHRYERLATAVENRALAREVTATGRTLSIVADPALSPAERDRQIKRARAEFDAVADPQSGVVVRLVSDGDRWSSGTTGIVLPESPDAPCVVIKRIDPERGFPRRAERIPFLSACGFYVRFGWPGEGMRDWLVRSSGRAAATPRVDLLGDPDLRNMRINFRQPWAGMSVAQSPVVPACAAGRLEACEAIFNFVDPDAALPTGFWTRGRPRHPEVPGSFVFLLFQGSTFSGDELAAVRLAMGDAAFAELWTSDQGPAEAYRALTGESIGRVMETQVMRIAEPYRGGPIPRGGPLALGVLLTATLAVVGVRATRRHTT